jgi:GTP:adenosylcobinamide-phosphate guanylyltransferase
MHPAHRNILPIKCTDYSTFSPTVIIPAAETNYQTRIWGAKSLIPVGGKYLIEHQIETILSVYPKADIILVVGPSIERIVNYLYRKYKIRFVHNKDYETKNVVHSLSLGLQASTRDNIMIVYGDLYFNKNAICIVGKKSTALIDNKDQILKDEVGIVKAYNLITNFGYEWTVKWGQIVYLIGNELSSFISYSLQKENENLFCYEILNKVIGSGGKLYWIEEPNAQIRKIVHPSHLEGL